MSEPRDQQPLKPEYDRYTGLELQPEAAAWLQAASGLSSTKLAIIALLSLVIAVEISEMTKLATVAGIIGLGAWDSLLRWKHAKSEKSTAAGSDESDHATKREGST